MDLLDGLTNYIISKQEGEFPGPLLVQPEVKTSPRVDRINEIMEELADPDQPIGQSAAQLDFLEKLKQDDRKRFTPDYILQKDYQKSPYSFFSEGYDPDIKTDFNPELVNKEYKDFINFFLENVKKPEFNDIIGSQTLSPFAQEIMPSVLQYEKRHDGTYPRDLFDLFQNVVTKDA